MQRPYHLARDERQLEITVPKSAPGHCNPHSKRAAALGFGAAEGSRDLAGDSTAPRPEERRPRLVPQMGAGCPPGWTFSPTSRICLGDELRAVNSKLTQTIPDLKKAAPHAGFLLSSGYGAINH